MATRTVSLPSTSPTAHHRGTNGRNPGRWEAVNRFVSAALVVALVIAIGAGAWRLADRGTGGGGPDPATLGVAGLVPAGQATPGSALTQPQATPPAVTPIEQLPGIQSTVLRSYSPQTAPASIADLFNISVGVYGFDSTGNAASGYDLLVQNQTIEFTQHAELNDTTLVTETLDRLGEPANLVRIVEDQASRYQVQQYVFTLHQDRVFAVMTVTGGPTALNQEAIDASTAAAVDLATALIEQGQPSPDDARFYADGTSTGGDWGFMPPAGDPLLLGLVPTNDQQLYPPDPGAAEASASYPPSAESLTGIIGSVQRIYATVSAVEGPDSTAGATPLTDTQPASQRFTTIGISVYEFETSKDAIVAFDRLRKSHLGMLADANQGNAQQLLVSEDLAGIGDKATQARVTVTSGHQEWMNQGTFEYITIQRGEFVFVLYAQSSLGPVEELPDLTDAPDPILELATQIAAEGEPSPEEPVYAEDGTSTGGLWVFMPAADDPLLMGLVPLMDQVLYPVPER